MFRRFLGQKRGFCHSFTGELGVPHPFVLLQEVSETKKQFAGFVLMYTLRTTTQQF